MAQYQLTVEFQTDGELGVHDLISLHNKVDKHVNKVGAVTEPVFTLRIGE